MWPVFGFNQSQQQQQKKPANSISASLNMHARLIHLLQNEGGGIECTFSLYLFLLGERC